MIILLAVAVLFFQAGSAFAGSCRQIEYAELKDTPSDRLISTFCKYGQLGKLDLEITKRYFEIKDARIKAGLATEDVEQNIAKSRANMDECFDQQKKIRSALMNRSETADPSCAS